MIGPVVGSVALVMVSALVMVLAVMLTLVAGRVVGNVLGDGGTSAAHGDGERAGVQTSRPNMVGW